MFNTNYLAESVEAARVASAERQMQPPPAVEFPFDIEPIFKQFKVYLPSPYFFPEIACPGAAKDEGFKSIRLIVPYGNGRYSVHAAPWASSEQVAEELEGWMLPF